MAYAEKTNVPIEKSEAEIKALLRKAGATAFQFSEDRSRAAVAFAMADRHVVFRLPLPDRNAEEFRMTPAGRNTRSADQQYTAWEQACRSRWRALFLCIKAKLESVESGIETFEEAFLPHIMMPDGSTVSELVSPRIKQSYETQTMQPLLPPPTGSK